MGRDGIVVEKEKEKAAGSNHQLLGEAEMRQGPLDLCLSSISLISRFLWPARERDGGKRRGSSGDEYDEVHQTPLDDVERCVRLYPSLINWRFLLTVQYRQLAPFYHDSKLFEGPGVSNASKSIT